MVNVNQVYTTVQAIMNIEQRGYLSPAVFNKYAQQVNLEIFESYFYDLAHYGVSRKGMVYDTGYSDLKKLLEEKINIFAVNGTATYDSTNTVWTLPSDTYRLNMVYYNNGTSTVLVPEITKKDKIHVLNSPHTAPSTAFPKYERLENNVEVYPATITSGIEIDYIKTPAVPEWGYVSIGSDRTPMYDSANSTNFELHPSDQYKIVQEILKYAGIQLREQDIVAAAVGADQQDEATKKQ